jgi:hypothetical protein
VKSVIPVFLLLIASSAFANDLVYVGDVFSCKLIARTKNKEVAIPDSESFCKIKKELTSSCETSGGGGALRLNTPTSNNECKLDSYYLTFDEPCMYNLLPPYTGKGEFPSGYGQTEVLRNHTAYIFILSTQTLLIEDSDGISAPLDRSTVDVWPASSEGDHERGVGIYQDLKNYYDDDPPIDASQIFGGETQLSNGLREVHKAKSFRIECTRVLSPTL